MHTIQQNYFDFFSLPIDFELDYKSLKKKYLAVQNIYHPDKLVNNNMQQKILATQLSTYANEAYNTLNNPAKLAIYWCNLHKIDTNIQVNINILSTIMEWHEQLQDNSSQNLQQILLEANNLFNQYIEKFIQTSKNNPNDKNLAYYAQTLLLVDKFIQNNA